MLELYEFACSYLGNTPCTKNAALHARRFFYVDQDDVKTDRTQTTFRTIKGTQKLHSVASTGVEGQVKTRLLTRYCQECIIGKYENCENTAFVEPFELVRFLSDFQPSMSDVIEEDSEDTEHSMETHETGELNSTYEMISKDSVVAEQPNIESLDDYFLFCVTSDGMVCLEDTVACSGHEYHKGTHVLYGFYYQLVKSNRKGSFYKRSKRSDSIIIPVRCVIYVGIDLDEDGDSLSPTKARS